MQKLYEIQILDSYNNETYVNGQAGSVYKQTPPLVNAMRKPGEWNVYDIIYSAPIFKEDGTYRIPPRVTVIQNGVVVQNNTTILGTTEYIGFPKIKPHEAGKIYLFVSAQQKSLQLPGIIVEDQILIEADPLQERLRQRKVANLAGIVGISIDNDGNTVFHTQGQHDLIILMCVHGIADHAVPRAGNSTVHSITSPLLYHKSIFYTSSFINSPTYPCA